MGQQQSKDELLYQQVNYCNIEGIKALHRDGSGLEWVDRDGKTPLIAACLNSELYSVAKTLIELGANVNAYRPGLHAGTPLHHAAKRGLEQTVKLLLSHGANALIMNDGCQTPLDVARAKGHNNVVRAIENHICLFAGWLREIYGPGFLEAFVPQLLSRKVWVVVLPNGSSRDLSKPFKLELAMYSTVQDAQPRTRIPLWKANLEEPNFSVADPTVIIVDISNKTRIKLGSANVSDKHQLQMFCNACKGIPQVIHSTLPIIAQMPIAPPAAVPEEEDKELAMAIRASLQSAMEVGPAHTNTSNASSSNNYNGWDTSTNPSSETLQSAMEVGPAHTNTSNASSSNNYNGWDTSTNPSSEASNGWEIEEASTSNNKRPSKNAHNAPSDLIFSTAITAVPSAPPIEQAVIEDGPIHYPSIDIGPLDLSSPTIEDVPTKTKKKEDTNFSSSCVICLDAPTEGACIPCGHMAGCMSCLNEIKAKNWGCPVCRADIVQVVRLYAV
ncbi:putative E3 ubiquitin-protein ligase XBAT34 [Impatiens glandulifera]|uniref:putative E3 ubiquitin-protein ligase XBAT34 n=1 Tax=Impatiens glandulifera TaxID=253017 RepID=UPI001FB0F1A7|nr:putative E3 ubiquitin-protein ligase XBAT34 [Impatiens glandulifera]